MADPFHRRVLESRLGVFAVLTTVCISIGGLVEIVPMFTVETMDPAELGVTPYTPLEVAGRDIYIREGCYLCHSQMIRPMRAETLRYGDWSRSAEYAYDRPFLLGSRRIGPDLAREGGNRTDDWHYEHMEDPRATSPGSVMPPYPWLYDATIDPVDVQRSVRALQRLGTPYTDDEVEGVATSLERQGDAIVGRLEAKGFDTAWDREIIALIAYLQRLGLDGELALDAAASASPEEASP